MTQADPEDLAQRLAAESFAVGDPTGWFERLYAMAERGEGEVPWDRGAPHRLLVGWAQERQVRGRGQRALVVGCGPGHDAEYLSGLGFETVAFDIAASAVRAAQARFPGSRVHYQAADLLNPPGHWRQAFDLVVESLTVQSLPDPLRRKAIAQVGTMVAAGGSLLVIARARGGQDRPGEARPGEGPPPWPLSRTEIEAFTVAGLRPVRIEEILDEAAVHRWRAEFRRPSLGRGHRAG